MITGTGVYGRFVIGTPTKCGTTTLESVAHRYLRQNPDGEGFRLVVEEKPRRQHRMVPPAARPEYCDALNADAHLLVRNPYARYTSIWEHLRAPFNYSQWGAKAVQGSAWGGPPGENEFAHRPPMTFSQFMAWYKYARDLDAEGELKKRPSLLDAGAYRSPWVWLDSLTDSYNFLQFIMTPKVNGEASDQVAEVRLIRLENLWEDLAALSVRYGVSGLDLRRKLHSNRAVTRWVDDHASEVGVPGTRESTSWIWARYYGGETGLCGPWNVSGLSRGDWVCANQVAWGGLCPVCSLGVHQEARDLGYLRTESGETVFGDVAGVGVDGGWVV